MTATVLNSPRAVRVSVHVVRAFIQLRTLLASKGALDRKPSELEDSLKDHDDTIAAILSAIRGLTNPPPQKSWNVQDRHGGAYRHHENAKVFDMRRATRVANDIALVSLQL